MQSLLILALAALSVANPLPVAVVEERRTTIEERQSTTGITSNEFTRLGCRNVLFFFARGSTEVGNMVSPLHSFIPLIFHSLLFPLPPSPSISTP